MSDNPTAGGYNRLACVIFPSSVGSTSLPTQKSCMTGEVDLKHLRGHLRKIHACHCAQPCKNAAHRRTRRPAAEIEHIIDVNKNECVTVANIWTEMFKRAHPDHENIPAPYLPCSGQLLALTQNPTVEFINVLGRAFANESVAMNPPAQEMVHNFFQLYHTFYEVVSRTGALPDTQTRLHVVAAIHRQGAVLSPACQRGLQLSKPSRDNDSAIGTLATQQHSTRNTNAAIDVQDCQCYGQSLQCLECIGKELDRFDNHPDLEDILLDSKY